MYGVHKRFMNRLHVINPINFDLYPSSGGGMINENLNCFSIYVFIHFIIYLKNKVFCPD